MAPMTMPDPATSTLESFSPTTGELLGAVPRADAADVGAAVADAARTQPFWAALPLADRARYMRRAAQVVIDSMDDLATLIAREHGKPVGEAAALELLPMVDSLHWIADHGPRLLRDERVRTRQLYLLGKRHRHVREPLGVVAVICSSSRPWAEPFLQTAIALMCGNAVIVKPAPEAALVGARVESALARAGLPAGSVRVVQGDDEVGEALAEAEGVAKVFFTGSQEAGRRVEAACGRLGRPVVLELGGKDPQLVLADARLDDAVAGAVWGAFSGAGQASAAIERVYVARELFDPFLDRLVERARALRLGDPLSPDTDVGPLVSAARADRVSEILEDAVARGATLHCGGAVRVEGLESASLFAPAVVTDVPDGARLAREPVPGPVLCVIPCDSEEDAVARANDSSFGLGASVWTRDRARGDRIARRLEAGMTWVNDHRYSHSAVQTAWGGAKASGTGRVHGEPGFRECVEIKLVASGAARAACRPWGLPYDRSLRGAAEAAARLLYGRDEDRLPALRAGAGPLVRVASRMVRGALRR
jgi:succinate-semialdehyde dehydrogenase/glutarate-semialdehyde dehydrogenase